MQVVRNGGSDRLAASLAKCPSRIADEKAAATGQRLVGPGACPRNRHEQSQLRERLNRITLSSLRQLYAARTEMLWMGRGRQKREGAPVGSPEIKGATHRGRCSW
jgi:hypothetical protein